MNYIEELENYIPYNEQEVSDKEIMLELFSIYGEQILTRECRFAHVSSSSMILNEDHTKVLMAFHNIYQSWSWTGGHADGQKEMLEVAKREAEEETGVTGLTLLKDSLWAIDILPVWSHQKRGKFVSSHLHLNFTYLFEAKENQVLRHKEDENSDVKWLEIKDLEKLVREPDMIGVYKKILREY